MHSAAKPIALPTASVVLSFSEPERFQKPYSPGLCCQRLWLCTCRPLKWYHVKDVLSTNFRRVETEAPTRPCHALLSP
jgi:hypothetical protein